MKKLNVLLLILMMSLTSYGQIYSVKGYLDKFDDIIKSKTIKTLITKTDSTFIFEEKGLKPVEYYILFYLDAGSVGDKDNLVDLTGKGVYGYQDCWVVIKMKDKDDYSELYEKVIRKEIEKEELEKYILYIIHRTVSRYSFEFEYDSDYFWIENEKNDNKLGKDVNRIVYLR